MMGNRTHLNADVQWTSAVTSANTGDYIFSVDSHRLRIYKKHHQNGGAFRLDITASSLLLRFLSAGQLDP